MTDTFENLRALTVAEFQPDPRSIRPETLLIELGVDSLAALEFAFDLEDAFRITLDPQTDLRGERVSDVAAAVDAALVRAAVPNPAD
jgi:acyl carrier protein